MISLQNLKNPTQLDLLAVGARAEGFRMVDRLQQEWREGTNRFEQAGEMLLLAVQNQRVVGVCGLNRDPYSDNDRVGRVRRLYVSVDSRRRGIGRLLVTEIQNHCQGVFDQLRLRADTPEADAFYHSLGFHRIKGDPECTHLREICL
ncbi:GNAT family N-acetyltransferase [Gimesia algae]|uniref:GNAT family N-acetyltransferase n=1 Tax=Gimesia algae TaxID=2527971 RepID=UPI0018D8E446|nr:GNAT family N-acetyltransferase [Gimesia algae]